MVFLRSSGFPIEQAVLGEGETFRSDDATIAVQKINTSGGECSWWADIEAIAKNESEQDYDDGSAYQLLTDDYSGDTYKVLEISGERGISISLTPGISVCVDLCDKERESYEDWVDSNNWHLTENHRLIFNISGHRWVLTTLRKNQNQTRIAIGKEESVGFVSEDGIETLYLDGEELRLFDRHGRDLKIGLDGNDTTKRNISTEEIVEYQGRYLKTWWYHTDYSGKAHAWMSSLSYILDLSEPENNLILEWENETSWNPALKSIFVPRSSPAFEKLSG